MSKLLSLLKSKIKSDEKGSDRLRTIACGFMLNLTNTHGNYSGRHQNSDKVHSHIDDTCITELTYRVHYPSSHVECKYVNIEELQK